VFAQAMAAGAEVRQPVQDMFWGDRHGRLEDPFGHRWNLSQPVRDVPHERYNIAVASSAPLCPSCGQPASEALGGPAHDWECRNEACPEFGQAVRADEPDVETERAPGRPGGAHG
jgi:hypothetical protein